MRGKTVLLNKSPSLSARKLEVKGNKEQKRASNFDTQKSVGNHPQKYVPKRKEDMHVSNAQLLKVCTPY